ncbi:MAG: SH3 domain-containing protein [Clostridiales bacterium]|nr:SH3 domain-containing protein [Clostridiales bacterium]
MKFIGITDQDKITKDKMISFAVVTGIVLLCVMSSAGIVSMMNYKARSDTIMQDERVGEILDETTTSGSVTEEMIIESPDSSTSETTTTTTTEDGTSTTTSSGSSSDATTTTSTSGETTTSKATTTSSKSTTSHTTLKEYYTVVYARTVVNIRSGPGKEYDLVKQLNEGDAIDVVAKTENGWYKTINGNYVLQSLTTSEKPKTTTTTTTTTKGTKDSTKSTTKSTTKATSGSKTTIDGKDMVSMGRFKVTFYGPQPLPNGSYSTTTATGTKCKEGRTIAADWSVLPAGTVIYVKNDPLGGDGYYTVEDKGGGVRGKMIDIYVDDESRWDDTTYVEVYIVK